jgi:hypothetical protein
MKKILTYTIVGALALGISGTATYALQGGKGQNASEIANANDNSVASSSSHVWGPDDFSNGSGDVTTGFEGMMNKLLASKDLDINSLNLKLRMPSMTTDLELKLSNATIDWTNQAAIKLTSDIEVIYGNIDLNLNIIFESGDYAYFSYKDSEGVTHKYSFSSAPDITQIVNLIPKLGVATPTMPALADLDLNSLLKPIATALQNPSESKTTDGYEYTVDLGSISVSPITVSGLKLVFGCDNDYNFSSLKIADDGVITIVDSNQAEAVTVGLKGAFKGNADSTYTDLTSDQKSTYQDVTNVFQTADSLCETIGKIADAKTFGSNLSFTLTSPDGTKGLIGGTIKGNYNDIQKDLAKGRYEIDLTNSASVNGTVKASEAYAYYDGANAYFKINDLVKGKMAMTDIKDIFTQVSAISSEFNTTSALTDEVNNIMGIFSNGVASIPKDLVKDFAYTETAFGFKVNANSLGLGNYLITVQVNTASDGTFKSVEIDNLQYSGFAVSFNMDLTSDCAFQTIDTSSYKDYAGVAGIFDTVQNICESKQASASYTLSATTSADKKYTASGLIEADASAYNVKPDDLKDKVFGNYHLSLDENDISAGTTHALSAYYQDGVAYAKFDDVFKNSVSQTEIGKIMDFVDTKTTASSADFSAASGIIDELKASETLKADIQRVEAGDLTALSSFVTIDKDNTDPTKIILTVDIAHILTDTSLKSKITGGITIEIDSTEKALTGISIKGLNYDSNSLDFALTINTYKDFKLSDADKATYVSADNAIESFINMPTYLKTFNVGLDASLVADGKTTSMTGFSNVDLSTANKPAAIGDLKVTESDATAHDIEFNYSTETSTAADGSTKYDGLTIAQYNDHMHIYMHNSSVLDIVDQVKNMDDTNLLAKYTKGTNSLVNGLPLLDAIQNKDYLSLLNGYVEQASITANQVILKVNPALFESSIAVADNKTPDTLTIDYDPTTCELTKAVLFASYAGKTINVSMTLGAYDSSKNPTDILAYNSTTSSQFINLDNLPLFVKMGLTTTEKNYFNLYGNFYMKLNFASTSIKLDGVTTFVTAKVEVVDGETLAYLSLNNTPSKAITDKGFYCTEYFITKDGSTYVCQTRNESGGNNYYSNNFKITQSEMLKNIVYYVVDYTLDVYDINFGAIAMCKIYDAMSAQSSSDVTIYKDYSQWIKSAVYDATNKKYTLDMNLAKVIGISGLSFKDVIVSITHNDNSQLVGLSIGGTSSTSTVLTAYSIVDINVSLEAASDVNAGLDMSRYDNYIACWKSNSNTALLGMYQVNSITTHQFILSFWRTINDNGNKYKASYGADSRFFYSL